MNFTALLNTTQAKEVFRRHHITATGIEGVRQGFAAKGDLFMFHLLQAISPKSSVLHGNFGTADEMGPPTFDQWTAQNNDASAPKRTIEDWLAIAGTIGTTIGSLKQNIFGTVTDPNAPIAPDPNAPTKSPVLIYAVAGIVILVIAFFLFKSKS